MHRELKTCSSSGCGCTFYVGPGDEALRREASLVIRLNELVEGAIKVVDQLVDQVPINDRRAPPLLGLAQSLQGVRHFVAEYQELKIAPLDRLELLSVFASISHAIAVQAFSAATSEQRVIASSAALSHEEHLAAAVHELRKAHRSVAAALGLGARG